MISSITANTIYVNVIILDVDPDLIAPPVIAEVDLAKKFFILLTIPLKFVILFLSLCNYIYIIHRLKYNNN